MPKFWKQLLSPREECSIPRFVVVVGNFDASVDKMLPGL